MTEKPADFSGLKNYILILAVSTYVISIFGAVKLIKAPKNIMEGEAVLLGDVNKDGKVDIFDYNLLVSNYGKTACGNIADINSDCKVDIFDYNLLVSNYGKVSGIATPTLSPTPFPITGLKAFPGAEGFGANAKGGRGGTVYRVTNLNDSGIGSLRACAENFGPRYCIFDVSGTIKLNSTMYIRNPYITIAGESAPSPGITLRGTTLSINASDIIIRHLRFRVGSELGAVDGFKIQGPNGKNSIADHISVSWGVDENVSMWFANADSITISNAIVSEALHNSVHPSGPHSKGILVGDGIHNISLINILAAHNDDRNFLVKGGGSAESINNLYYNFAEPKATGIGGGISKGTVIGNVYIKGPNTYSGSVAVGTDTGALYYGSDIKTEGIAGPGASSTTSTRPVWSGLTSPDPSSSVENMLYTTAGARPKDRDSVDIRIINEVKSRTGKIIDNTSQVGGWPTLAQNHRTFLIPSNPNGDDDRDGYTNLEEVLHQYSAALE